METLTDLLTLAAMYPSRTIAGLLTFLGCIDYVLGSNPGSTTEKYIGITRRLLHQLKQVLGGKKK